MCGFGPADRLKRGVNPPFENLSGLVKVDPHAKHVRITDTTLSDPQQAIHL